MFSFLSLIKSLAATAVIVLLLQVRIGTSTVEENAVSWFRSSSMISPLQSVVDGGVRLIRNTVSGAAQFFDFGITEKIKNRPGKRDLQLKLERSREYIREKAEKVSGSWQESEENKK
jgi:hypothetical protein